jgi:tetratricopeptide (TPR) repeat protein
MVCTNILAYAKPAVSNLATPVSYYINHVSQLHELANNLLKYKKASIIGTSGIGKTQLVRMYAYESKEQYDVIWFIDCNLNLNQEFLKLAKAINEAAGKQLIPENLSKIKEEVMDYLVSKNDWLLVLDNNKTKSNLKELVDWENNGHVVFCSQNSKDLPYIITLKHVSSEDAVVLAKSILRESSTRDINFLVDEFKGYPVLIVQGAQILNNIKGLSFAKYKKMIHEVDNKIKLNIELSMQELPASSNDLLKKIALINNQRFSKEFLKMIANNKDTLDDDIYQLSRLALIANVNTADIGEDNLLFEMHDVIVDTIQAINTKEENKKSLEEIIVNTLEKSFPRGVAERQIFRTQPTVIENLQIILKNAEKFNIDIYKNLELRLELFGISLDSGDYNNCTVYIEWLETKDRNKEFNIHNMNDHDTSYYAWYLSTIGFYNMVALSNPINAIKYYMRAKAIASHINNYEDMKFNVTYQIFRAQLELGEIESATKTLEDASQIYEVGLKNNSINPSERCYFYFGGTRLFLAQGKYQEALEQINHAIEFLKQSGIKETSMFLQQSYQMKIEILNYLGRYQESYALAEWLSDALATFTNSDHEIFANIHTKMAVAEYGQGKYKAGLDDANKAALMFIKVRNIDPEKIQFSKDIQLAKALTVKADCLSALGVVEESLEIYEKAESIYNNVYIGHLDSSINLRHILFEGARTACKKPSEVNTFWFKHFYNNLRSIFGISIPEIKTIEEICSPDIYKTH